MSARSATAAVSTPLLEPDYLHPSLPARSGLDLSSVTLHRRFREELRPRPVIYWADLAMSATLGWLAFAYFLAAPFGALSVLACCVAAVSLYRAVLFIHEIAHLKRGAVPWFEAAWNAIVGVPMLAPSLMYAGTHADHHRNRLFSTEEDPEYDTIAFWKPWRIVSSFATMTGIPMLLLLRWGVLGPLSYFIRPLREFLVARMSTLVINPSYRRRPLTRDEVRAWAMQEWSATALIWLVAALMVAGTIPVDWALRWYALVSGVLLLNHARTLAAHRYFNDESEPVDRVGQLLDSVNLVGSSWLTPLAAPVGLRYHALHHLLPTLPYHSLGRVHRALIAELPADSPYRATCRSGVLAGLGELIAHARTAS